MHRGTFLRGVAVTGVLAMALAACGGGGGAGSGSATGKTVVIGTTDKVTSFDPAGSYDLGSWTGIYNIYQNLMSIPAGGNTPQPDAASTCSFTAPTTYQCTLKDGLKFSNGDPLTAQDVKFSFERIVKIDDPNGPVSLLGSMASVAAPDDKTVTFTLKAADATFPFVLTTGAGAIVPSKVFPADKLQPSESVVGSGPYKLAQYKAGQQAVFEKNPNYKGSAKLANDRTILQYFDQASALKLAIEQGNVDVAYRSLSPTDIQALRGESSKGVQIVEGQGTEIRYMVFQTKDPVTGQKPVRQAIAQLIDRAAIAKNAFSDTVTPLYSMIPAGLQGHTEAFKDRYGAPSVDKAKAILSQAGIQTPVKLQLWWTPSHYGPASADEYTEIKRQLEASGLFTVDLKSTEWQEYQKAYKAGQYPAYQLGWFPDFPDADNYSSPFLLKGGFFKNNYDNPQVDKLITTEQTSTDNAARMAAFQEIQKITAEDVPVLPIWQGKQVAAVRTGVSGVDKTFDPSFTFRFWLVGKK